VRSTARSPLLAAAACWTAFAAVLVCAYEVGATGRLDAIALHGLMALEGPFVDPVAHVLAHSADPLPLMVILASLFAWGWARGRRWEALAAVALVAGANLTALVLKVTLAHPRFYPVLGADQVGSDAFPSGHATSSMSIALAAVLVTPARVRLAVASGAAAYVIAVSTSLLVLSWHLPSDVLGGLLVASAFFFCAVAAIRLAAGVAGADRRAGVAAWGGARLSPSPGFGGVAVAALAGAGLIALSRADEMLAFARLHTVAAATALALVVISAGLVASATLIADR
jgi:membrane-associated phospholipid phosphatase